MIRNSLTYPEEIPVEEELDDCYLDLDFDFGMYDMGIRIILPNGDHVLKDIFFHLEDVYTIDGWYSYTELGPDSSGLYVFYLDKGKMLFQELTTGEYYCSANDITYPSKEVCDRVLKLKAFI